MVFRRQMAQITLKAEPLCIVTHIVDGPVAANENSVIMVRHAIKSCEAGKSKIKGRIQDVPSRVQGLFVTFTRVGSGDPVRVLRLFHNKYAGYN